MTPPGDVLTCGERWRHGMWAGASWMSASPLTHIMCSTPAGLATVRPGEPVIQHDVFSQWCYWRLCFCKSPEQYLLWICAFLMMIFFSQSMALGKRQTLGITTVFLFYLNTKCWSERHTWNNQMCTFGSLKLLNHSLVVWGRETTNERTWAVPSVE